MAMRKGKCTCNLGYVILGWILAAIGIWALATGFITQLQVSATPVTTLFGWYFSGIVLISIAKMLKWKGHGSCPVHGFCPK